MDRMVLLNSNKINQKRSKAKPSIETTFTAFTDIPWQLHHKNWTEVRQALNSTYVLTPVFVWLPWHLYIPAQWICWWKNFLTHCSVLRDKKSQQIAPIKMANWRVLTLKLLLRLRSHLVLEHGTRVRFLLSTNVNTPFFKYPRQNSGTVPTPKHKVGTEPGTYISSTQCLNTAPFVLVPWD